MLRSHYQVTFFVGIGPDQRPSDDLLERHANHRHAIVVCARGGLGSFAELSKVDYPTLMALYEDSINAELMFRPDLERKS